MLRITNDGATPTHRHSRGLANLQARVSAACGRLTLNHHHDAHFTLTAEVPAADHQERHKTTPTSAPPNTP